MAKTIIIGACGQIGTELVHELRRREGEQNVIASDVKELCPPSLSNGPYVQMDILDREQVRNYIIQHEIKVVYLLAALLSATAEKNPDFAWKLNMDGLFTILDLAKDGYVEKIFWITRLKRPLWSQQRFMGSPNRRERGGVSITSVSSGLMCEVYAIRG